jgi:hypothetical protein
MVNGSQAIASWERRLTEAGVDKASAGWLAARSSASVMHIDEEGT